MATKHVLIIEPQSSGLSFITAAKKLGFRVSVMTANSGDRQIPEAYAHMVDHMLIHDTNDSFGALGLAKIVHESSLFTCVVPGFEYYVPLTASIAHELGLKGLPIESVESLRLKNKMRDSLRKANVPVPQYFEVTTPEQVLDFAQTLVFPVVVKPTNLSGSIGVKKVSSIDELRQATAAIWNHTSGDLELKVSSEILIEEYISGPEFSAEGYVTKDGEVHFLSITKKLLSPEPWFVETGHVVNFSLDESLEKKVKLYLVQVIQALGINLGPFHAEFRVREQDQQPILMEIGARLAGDKICDLIQLSTGINLAEISLQLFSGEELSIRPVFHLSAGITFFIEKGGETIDQYLSYLREIPGFISADLKEKPTNHEATDFSGRLGHAVFVNHSIDLVKDAIHRANHFVLS